MRKTFKDKKPKFKYKNVMLIDDNELDNFINQKIIEANFFAEKVYLNTSAISAFEFLKNLNLNANIAGKLMPEVIFIDINMPMIDGFQFIEQFLTLPGIILEGTKLVILTSSINPEDKRKAMNYKFDINFMNKPLNDESLSLL